VFRLIDALAAGDGKTVVETSETLRRDGLSAASTLEEMTTVLQAMAVLQAVPARADLADGTDPEAAETARLAASMPPDETQLLYSLCLHGRGELGLAPDEYAALTMVLLRLLAFKPSGEKKTLNEPFRAALSVDRPAAMVAQAPVPVAAPVYRQDAPVAVAAGSTTPPGHRLPVIEPPSLAQPRTGVAVVDEQPAPAVLAMQVRVQPPPGARDMASNKGSGAPLVTSEDGDFWHDTVMQMVTAETIGALTRELALQSQLVARDVDQWLLRVERESLNQAASREKLQAALASLGHGVKLAVEIGHVVDSPARRNKLAAEARQRAAEKVIHNDPFVQSMMRDFDARIVPGTLRPA
jgi:DNA polymerase-3 subunit gamma/tau